MLNFSRSVLYQCIKLPLHLRVCISICLLAILEVSSCNYPRYNAKPSWTSVIRGYLVYSSNLNWFYVNNGSLMGMIILIMITYFCCMYPKNLKTVSFGTKIYHSNELTINRNWSFFVWQYITPTREWVMKLFSPLSYIRKFDCWGK